MAANHHAFAQVNRHPGRTIGLSRGGAAIGVLAVLAIQTASLWCVRRSQRARYEGHARILEHRIEIAQGAADQSYREGFADGIEACRVEIQAGGEDEDGALASVLTLRPKRTVPIRVVHGRELDSGA
jgi:hypothetical protein